MFCCCQRHCPSIAPQHGLSHVSSAAMANEMPLSQYDLTVALITVAAMLPVTIIVSRIVRALMPSKPKHF